VLAAAVHGQRAAVERDGVLCVVFLIGEARRSGRGGIGEVRLSAQHGRAQEALVLDVAARKAHEERGVDRHGSRLVFGHGLGAVVQRAAGGMAPMTLMRCGCRRRALRARPALHFVRRPCSSSVECADSASALVPARRLCGLRSLSPSGGSQIGPAPDELGRHGKHDGHA
jgi:hypothetical protein